MWPVYPLGSQIFDNDLKDQEREVCFVDIAYDEIPERYYKESEVGSRVPVLGTQPFCIKYLIHAQKIHGLSSRNKVPCYQSIVFSALL